MRLIITLAYLFLGFSCYAAPIEVGTINWGRNYEEALEKSRETGKPIFLLFQEVPGCQGCQDFGKTVLSNPLIKKSVEEAFIPLMIQNNTSGGYDQQILKKFKEPSWNYQVVRFINAKGKDIIPRKDRIWDIKSLAVRMKEALKKSKQSIPAALDLAHLEADIANHTYVAYAMYCYWTGEAQLGKIDGVIKTEAGYFDGREVTLVIYHKDRITLNRLTAEAEKVDCANAVYIPEGAPKPTTAKRIKVATLTDGYRKAKDKDQKRQLSGIKLKTGNYTAGQLTKLNSFIRTDKQQAMQYYLE